jgi:hypothetical protein
MGRIDFSISSISSVALIVAAVFPLYLAAVSRLPPFVGRNALQFTVSVLLMVTTWITITLLWLGSPHIHPAEVCVALMMLFSGALVYLEIWALLSRGYTLGLMLTLLDAGGRLGEEALALRYRGGESLSWVMQHRMSGLVGAGLVRNEDGVIRLTGISGVFVARGYKIVTRILGLRRTG